MKRRTLAFELLLLTIEELTALLVSGDPRALAEILRGYGLQEIKAKARKVR